MTANKARNLSMLNIGDVDYPFTAIVSKAIRGGTEVTLPINDNQARKLRESGFVVEHFVKIGEYKISW